VKAVKEVGDKYHLTLAEIGEFRRIPVDSQPVDHVPHFVFPV
jgi:hypothetical protein